MKTEDYYLCGEINLESERDFIKFLNEQNADENVREINLYINSAGGMARSGLAMSDAILTSKKPISTICLSCAMSMAFLIFVSGCHRKCFKHSTFLYHEISNDIGDERCTHIQNELSESQRLQRCMDEIILEQTDIHKEKLDEVKAKCKDWFIPPADAKELGIVNGIIE